MKTIKKSELRELLKTRSLRDIAKIYGVSYERIRQICVMWGIPRRGWQKIELVNDERFSIDDLRTTRKYKDKPRNIVKK